MFDYTQRWRLSGQEKLQLPRSPLKAAGRTSTEGDEGGRARIEAFVARLPKLGAVVSEPKRSTVIAIRHEGDFVEDAGRLVF